MPTQDPSVGLAAMSCISPREEFIHKQKSFCCVGCLKFLTAKLVVLKTAALDQHEIMVVPGAARFTRLATRSSAELSSQHCFQKFPALSLASFFSASSFP